MASNPDDARTLKLSGFFNKVLHGQRTLSTARDGKLFIEALCAQTDPATCAHKLISSQGGLLALQASVRFDTSPLFLNDNALTLLQYLQSPSLKMIDSGSILNQLLLSMVEPPFFWDACVKSFVDGLLNPGACHAFAWLLLQLACLPGKASSPYVAVANSQNILDSILKSPNGETRILGQKIKHALPQDASQLRDAEGSSPGGRHDNDHANYKEILIMPTADELLSKDRPFLRTADFIDDPELVFSRRDMHLDNQFRLLREDMLCEIRDELKILTGGKLGRHKGIVVDGLSLAGVEMGTERKRIPWCVVLKCNGELPQLKNLTKEKKKDFLKDNRHILRHGNMACLTIDDEPAAFPTIHRDEDRLAADPATITVQFPDDSRLSYALSKMKTAKSIKLIQLDAAIFAFEPFLRRLQDMVELPLAEELLYWGEDKDIVSPSFKPTKVIAALEKLSGKNVQDLLGLKKKVVLDDSQMISLCTSLFQRVSLIQGPPGTGKSFIGALIAKVLHDSTSQRVLIVCFTNHALDQFLEDLIDIGIPQSAMVRLGGKSSDRTRPLMIREMTSMKLSRTNWAEIDRLKQSIYHSEERLKDCFGRYRTANTQKKHLMEYLEFLCEDLPFFDAFSVPQTEDNGMTRVGKSGKAMGPFYLLDRWIRGESNAGSLQHLQPKGCAAVWKMPLALRQSTLARWQTAILDDLVMEIRDAGRQFNSDQAKLDKIFREKDAGIIKTKRIIACTTNGAAKYSTEIQNATPGVVLVEEAGEILEAHILTSLGPCTEQLILIGDHKQLRPKCSYELSVDKGEGFDLNRSLFERLVLKGFPHTTLSKQHRMRPEISSMIRHLTYPDLIDADSTRNRANIHGFCDNVIFVNHSQPEIELQSSKELRDGRTTSKQNVFEAQMILKCVRYLAQQGYSSDKLVVITPYLGQLKLLREHLAKYNDPILNDLDKFDLVRAGLLTDLSSKSKKPSLRISTIDNYQGEESDIVLVSMTRSNKAFDIGFMAAPERLNVLLSRARDGLIMIGNSETFMHARKGKDIWRKLFAHLKENDHTYKGFPVKCEKHPDRTALLCKAEDFEAECPDGGCKEPCGVMLKCGLHKCPSSCHQLFNHDKILCQAPLTQKCSNGHNQSWRCHQSAPLACQKCERDRKEALKKAQKALEEKERREEKMRKHQEEIARIDEEIERINQKRKEMRLDREQQAILLQKQQDLAAAKERANMTTTHQADVNSKHISTPKNESNKITSKPSPTVKSSPNTPSKPLRVYEHIKSAVEHNKSPSQTEWQRQKDQENAKNPAIDKIMEMIGLEHVKSQVLKIKAKVETALRQDSDLKKERLGLTLLGNPGTGKTTVARHYAKVLSSLKALPGDGFIETTGSRLAHGGIAEVKNHLQQLENSEGGVYFIDEAYQLTEAHNYGGKPVLDFLLAEIENLTGRVVFVFAGYRKQMEKFFEHNPGLSSRIPYTLQFDDYTDAELLKLLHFQINQFFKHGVDIEGGPDGLYMRIAVRRLGRGRGRDGFGNARALENMFAQIQERQSERLTNQRKEGTSPDDNHISKEDLIGPDPSKAILNCNVWTQLQQLIGLESVKKSISTMIDLIKTNYVRELDEKEIIGVSLNRIFLGPPGTGKTTVAKLYGQILADIGLLSNGEVVIKNPSDFIGNVIGQSEANTKAILATTVGKVLIIDEAYMLYSSSDSVGNTGTFKTSVIDTIVAEVQSVPGDDRCVLLLGYESQMLEMFQNVNPGLTRRFQLSDAFRFEDFNDSELQEILELKLKKQDLGATPEAVSTAVDVLARLRNGLNFGNGGDVETLISKAKVNYQARQSALPVYQRSPDFIFEPQDFDPDYDRSSKGETNLQELFKGVVGCEGIIAKLDGFLKVAQGMRAQGLDPRGQIPMNFIFKGPPETGKTTTARKFGQIYYDLGLLSRVEVVECSAADLIGQYVGHTGPKTIKQLERGLGKVLFIDEAYRLGQGHFAQEAIDELVDNITKPRFLGKLVIILAGYDNDMDNLLRVNEGLSSRFADEIIFPPLSSKHCLQLLEDTLKKSHVAFPSMHDPAIYLDLQEQIEQMSKFPGWGNARDVQSLAKTMVRAVYQSNLTKVDQLILPAGIAQKSVREMLVDRCKRAKVTPPSRPQYTGPVQSQDDSYSPPPVGTGASTTTKSEAPKPKEDEALEKPEPGDSKDDGRDAGVPDDVWEQLQRDKMDAESKAQKIKQNIRELEEAQDAAKEVEKEAMKAAAALQEMKAKDNAEILERLRLREEARIREIEAKAAAERIREELENKRREEEQKRKKEELAQRKLREMGVCVAGFRWIKQSGGYRCAGGTHWVSDSKLN